MLAENDSIAFFRGSHTCGNALLGGVKVFEKGGSIQ